MTKLTLLKHIKNEKLDRLWQLRNAKLEKKKKEHKRYQQLLSLKAMFQKDLDIVCGKLRKVEKSLKLPTESEIREQINEDHHKLRMMVSFEKDSTKIQKAIEAWAQKDYLK